MASNKTVGISLMFDANISKAKTQLESLQKQLSNLTNNTIKNADNGLGLTKQMSEALSKATQLRNILTASTSNKGVLDLGAFTKNMNAAGMDVKSLQTSFAALGPEGNRAFRSLSQSVVNAQVPIRQANTIMSKFADSLKQTMGFQFSSSVYRGFIGSIQKAFSYSEKLNASLTNIRIVTGQSTDQMKEFAVQANKAARSLATTTTAYTDAALIFYQQGKRRFFREKLT